MPSSENTSSVAASFASVIAALARQSEPEKAPEPAALREEGDLADDLVTLSYESALRAHARYKSPEEPAPAVAQPMLRPASEPVASVQAPVRSAAAPEPATPANRRKCASVTIRMSEAECAQLRQRAAQAGMTVSAYLRSCTFEVEALRAQVKEVMTQLRAATPPAAAPAPVPAPTSKPAARRPWRPMLERLFPGLHPVQHPVRA